MSVLSANEKMVADGVLVLHPIRWKIMEALKDGKPRYIDEIATLVKEDRRLVSFHLSTLEENGFAVSEFKIIEPPHSMGKAGRFYKLTDKFDKIRPELIKFLK